MRGYAGRETNKPTGPITVQAAHPELISVMETVNLLSKLGEVSGKHYTRLNSAWSGVSWLAYNPESGVPTTLIEVSALNYKLTDYEIHPYPIERFIAIPMMLQAAFKVGLIIKFSDGVAARVISEKLGDIADLILNARVGHTLDEPGYTQLVADFTTDSFTRVAP